MTEGRRDGALCVLFFGFLGLFFFISLIKPDQGFSEFENRYLSAKPPFSWEEIWSGSYMKKYEDYVTDQFPFRNQWITGKTLTERLMLKQEINGVYFAGDNYFIERHRREEIFSEQSVKNQESLIAFVRKYTELLGDEHVSVMLVPTASAVLTDRLPPLAPTDGQTELLEAMRSRMPGGIWVEAYEALLQHRDEEIYYRTDHHWTTLGAFYGYGAWKRGQGEEPPDRSEFEEICLTDSFTGTLYAKVNMVMKPDSIYAFIRPEEELSMRLDGAGEWLTSLYATDRLSTRDKYAVFCDGNHAMTEIRTELSNGRHLLLIKDSYAHCLAPFFTADFEQITMLDLRYYNGGIEDYIRTQRVTDVVTVYNLAGFSSDRFVNKLTK